MKFGYLHNTGRKHNTSAFMAEKRSSSPRTIEATPCQLTEQIRMDAVEAGAVSQRLRLNLG
jgi:hypothetical protein